MTFFSIPPWTIAISMFGLVSLAAAEPTQVDVRVISKGAKFVGTSMGGAEITIQDAETGQVLARGKTAGSTGDTDKIMREQQTRHSPVSTKDAAVFHADLDLEAPRRVRVTARGPLAQLQSATTVSVTQWVIPGKDITGGDALTLEMPGFVVDVLSPPAHKKLSQQKEADDVEIRANVTMMCGCPIAPDGLWDANQFEVAAIVHRDGTKLEEVPLKYSGETSQFSGLVDAIEPGAYVVTVYAFDPANGNTGLDRTSFVVP